MTAVRTNPVHDNARARIVRSTRPTATRTVLLSLWAVALSAPALSATINVPADQATIQGAINAANTGDVVVVAPGTYTEFVRFFGKAITVRSASGPEVTTISAPAATTRADRPTLHLRRRVLADGSVELLDDAGNRVLDAQGQGATWPRGGTDSTVIFANGETRQAVLQGFTITGGDAQFDGGGVRIQSASSPTLRGNIITNNRACSGGGGISIRGNSSPLVEDNIITNNRQFGCSGGGGGGIEISSASNAEIRGNRIAGNSFTFGGGISLFAAGTPVVANNLIENNISSSGGGGLDIVNVSNVALTQNILRNNIGGSGRGDGIDWLVPSGAQGPTAVQNTLIGNGDLDVLADGFDVAARLIGNIIVSNTGGTAVLCGNFNDPNPPVLQFNNVHAPGGTAYAGLCTNPTGTSGNLSADPLFIDPANGNYRLQATSPSIDAGDNTTPNLPATDFAGATRIVDGDNNGTPTVDQGAHEFFVPQPLLQDGFEAVPLVLWER